MGIITFNGITSKSLGIEVEVPPNYEIAERIYNVVPLPGRNGDLVEDTGAFKNVVREYAVSIGEVGGNHTALAGKIAQWLYSSSGYVRLEDSYEPDYVKMARYVGTNPLENIMQQAGRMILQFDRKPQRFLKSGQTAVVFNKTGTITNPTYMTAKPYIDIHGNGNGSVTIGNHTINLTNIIDMITVNSDIEDVYKGPVNMNMNAKIINGFPLLHPGNTNISFNGGVTAVYIVPNWWVL